MAEDSEKTTKREVEHRPDWHPSFSPLLGEFKGAYGYVTATGTISLMGPLYKDPEISKWTVESEILGPMITIAATGLF